MTVLVATRCDEATQQPDPACTRSAHSTQRANASGQTAAPTAERQRAHRGTVARKTTDPHRTRSQMRIAFETLTCGISPDPTAR